MDPIEAVNGGAPGTRLALVAGVRRSAEVITAGSLHEVATGGRHVAQLRRRAREECLREQREMLGYRIVMGKVAVADHGADAQSSVRQSLNVVEWQVVNVHQCRGQHHIELHQIDQRGAAGDERRSGAGTALQCVRLASGLGIFERDHQFSSQVALLSGAPQGPYRRENIGISTTPANVPSHALTEVVIGGTARLFQKSSGRHYLTGRAVPALKGIVFNKGSLHWM